MLNLLAVFTGGGLGACLRYLTGVLISGNLKINLPVATFLVNIIGCFLIGFLYVIFVEKLQASKQLKLLLTVGFCGGLTTFSTFALESMCFLKDGKWIHFVIYILASIILGLTAAYSGFMLTK